MEQSTIQVGDALVCSETKLDGYHVVDKTANSVQVFMPRIFSKDKNKIGINCLSWFSNVQNNKGESDFNKRFKAWQR